MVNQGMTYLLYNQGLTNGPKLITKTKLMKKIRQRLNANLTCEIRKLEVHHLYNELTGTGKKILRTNKIQDSVNSLGTFTSSQPALLKNFTLSVP